VKIISCDIYAEMGAVDGTAVTRSGYPRRLQIAKRGGIESCG
jgi:hypothetical protein